MVVAGLSRLAMTPSAERNTSGRGPGHPKGPEAKLRALLRARGLAPLRSRGQHFLVDEGLRDRILAAAELQPTDVVVEVGPGLGILTKALGERVRRVVAVELDTGLAALLQESLAHLPQVRVVNQDILQVNLPRLLAEAGGASLPSYKVVANLPYAITSPTLRLFLQGTCRPSLLVVMVQKEVAQRIAAAPGQMGYLSVLVQFYCQPELLEVVRPQAFFPPPRVDSALLRLRVYARLPVEVEDEEGYFGVVQAGFSRPRKQLHNALAQGLWFPPGGALALLQEAHIDPRRRAQTLTLPEWAHLAALLRAQRRAKPSP